MGLFFNFDDYEENKEKYEIEYEEFMKKYHNEHKYCPFCGSDEYLTTLSSYIFDRLHPEEYKDLNVCTCGQCKNEHVFHMRVKEFKKEN